MRGFKPMVQDTVSTPSTAFRKFRTCDRKKIYGNMDKGWGAVKHIQSNGNDRFPDFELRPYECEYCGEIHVGHSNTPKSSEARMKQEAERQRIANR